MKEELLRVENLAVTFEMYQGKLSKRHVQGIKDISLSVYTGEILAVVGASGSGKTLLAHAIMGLLPYNSTVEGEDFFIKENLLTPKQQELYRGYRDGSSTTVDHLFGSDHESRKTSYWTNRKCGGTRSCIC